MLVSNFDYELPEDLIANSPISPRDHSRLMIIDRKDKNISHHKFFEIEEYLGKNDVLVLNKTKVFPARIYANKTTGGKVEILFLEETESGIWKALTHPGVKMGTKLVIKNNHFEIVGQEGMMAIINTNLIKDDFMKLLRKYGHTPIPPYIKNNDSENSLRKEYQTVYADSVGSVAAPTAGFHFTKELLNKLKAKGVQIEYVTLHVGMGTFSPVKVKDIKKHVMHYEEYYIDEKTATRLNKAKSEGRRIISVGTTSTRTLESVADKNGYLDMGKLTGSTNIFIYPPYKFKFIDVLITNFHLPKSTLIALVSAFVSSPNTEMEFKDFKTSLIGKAYLEAIDQKYRFYSFGDASFII